MTTTVPPQAYTRDVLVKAFEWLNHQPEAIRDRATSADSLVSLYLQAKRKSLENGGEPMTSAASVEAFKADLKSLAEGLKQFEVPSFAPPQIQPVGSVARSATNGLGPRLAVEPAPHPISVAPPPPPPVTLANLLDSRSLEFIRDYQYRMNLSSESEALRALIALGYDRARDFLPRS